MPISYRKMLLLFQERGITSYTIKKDNVIGQASYKKIQEGGHIDTRTIESLCKYLHCQPGDIMEYVEEGPKREQPIPHPSQEKRTIVVTTRSEAIPAKPIVIKVPIHETKPAEPIVLKLPVQKAEPIQKPIIVHVHNEKDTED